MRNRNLVNNEQAQAQVGVARWCTRWLNPSATEGLEEGGEEFIGYRDAIVANRQSHSPLGP